MQETMIYGDSLLFDKLIEKIRNLSTSCGFFIYKDNKGKHFVCAMNKVLTFKLANRDYLFD